jgi:hypothetical protein
MTEDDAHDGCQRTQQMTTHMTTMPPRRLAMTQTMTLHRDADNKVTGQCNAMQTMEDNADGDAATQTTGNDSDNDNTLQRRQQGDVTTSQKRVVVVLVRGGAVEVALATAVGVAVAMSVVVGATVMVPVAAAGRPIHFRIYAGIKGKPQFDVVVLSIHHCRPRPPE